MTIAPQHQSPHEMANSLAAVLEIDHRPVLFDLAQERTHHIDSPDEIRSIINSNLVLFADAKDALTKWHIPPSPGIKIICLTTIKKLIAKSIAEGLTLPEFPSPAHALPWIRSAANDAFDRLNKLDMAELASLECQVLTACLAMEQKGLPFKKARWHNALTQIEIESAQIKAKLDQILPNDQGFLLFGQEPIDLNNAASVKQSLEKLLGQKLEGTSQSSLKDFDHEAVHLLLSYREHTRMLSTYGEAFLAKIKNDRVHGHFTPIASASGRFACHDPNLLALPNHQAFQACIEPTDGRSILHFDYGAFELRILAALSGDELLIRIFNEQQDIHAMVAQEIFNVKVSKTENPHLRDQAKVLNFGLIYGMGEQALARQLKITKVAAAELLRNYFKRFPRVAGYLSSLENMAKTKGYVTTALNRRAYFSDEQNDSHIARLARNIPIQGTGADIVKLALCRVYQRLCQSPVDAHIINVVHDEIVIELSSCHHDEVTQLVRTEMTEAFSALCPGVPADISVS